MIAPEDARPIVLFVDDDERLLESMRLVLRREPYRLFTASTVTAAERILAAHAVHVIVCDERMPTASGTQFLAALRKRHVRAIRIVLTGAGMPAARRAINDAQVFRFLTKPSSAAEIVSAVRDAVCAYAAAGASHGPPLV